MKFVSFDLSTKFAAYALWEDTDLLEYSKIYTRGTGDEAIGSFTESVVETFTGVDLDRVVYESSFLGNNVNVVKQLSKTTGAVIGGTYLLGVREYVAVPPITWQTGIGVGKTSTVAKTALKKQFPEKSATWLKNRDRENRKQLVIDYVNAKYKTGFYMNDNDLADAVAIGSYMLGIWGLE